MSTAEDFSASSTVVSALRDWSAYVRSEVDCYTKEMLHTKFAEVQAATKKISDLLTSLRESTGREREATKASRKEKGRRKT